MLDLKKSIRQINRRRNSIYNGAVNGVKCVMVSALGNIIGARYLIYLSMKQIRSTQKKKIGSSYPLAKDQRRLLSYFKEGLFVAITKV